MNGLQGSTFFDVFDAGGASLGVKTVSVVATLDNLGQVSDSQEFLGVIHPEGVSGIRLAGGGGLELEHLNFGRVPENAVESSARRVSRMIRDQCPTVLFVGPNDNAKNARRKVLSDQVHAAARRSLCSTTKVRSTYSGI